MTREELQRRLKFIKGQPLKEKVRPTEALRRGINSIDISKENESDFDDFFEFEEDIADMVSARKQFERMELQKMTDGLTEQPSQEVVDEPIVISDDDLTSGFLVLEEADEHTEEHSNETKTAEEPEAIAEKNDDLEKESTDNGPVFNPNDIKNCGYTKSDGAQCKRQAPKNFDFCSSHRKMLEKQKNNY